MIVFILCICAVRIKIRIAVFGKCYCIWKFTAWANITEQNICQYIPAFHSTVEGEDNCRNIFFPLIDQDRTASDNGNDSIRIHTLYTMNQIDISLMKSHACSVSAHSGNITSVSQIFSFIAMDITGNDHYCISICCKFFCTFQITSVIIKDLCFRHFFHQAFKWRNCIIWMNLTGTMVADIFCISQYSKNYNLLCFLFIKRKYMIFILQKYHRFFCCSLCYCYMFRACKNIFCIFLRIFSCLIIEYSTKNVTNCFIYIFHSKSSVFNCFRDLFCIMADTWHFNIHSTLYCLWTIFYSPEEIR